MKIRTESGEIAGSGFPLVSSITDVVCTQAAPTSTAQRASIACLGIMTSTVEG
jgi:hypothetical protein